MTTSYRLKIAHPLEAPPGPHLHTPGSSSAWIWGRSFALLPAWLVSFVCFGQSAFWMVAAIAASASAFEHFFQNMLHRKNLIQHKISFLNATLLAFLLPPNFPLHFVILGAFFVVIFGRELLGRLGEHLLHPVFTSYVFLMIIFPEAFSRSAQAPVALCDPRQLQETWYYFLGSPKNVVDGAMMLAFALGGGILIARKRLPWEIPFFYLATLGLIAAHVDSLSIRTVCSSSFFYGGFFLLTNLMTVPVNQDARSVFGISSAIFSALFLIWTQDAPTSIVFSGLLMNVLTPALEQNLRRDQSKIRFQ